MIDINLKEEDSFMKTRVLPKTLRSLTLLAGTLAMAWAHSTLAQTVVTTGSDTGQKAGQKAGQSAGQKAGQKTGQKAGQKAILPST